MLTPGYADQERAASEKLLQGEREHAGVQAELISAVGGSPAGTLHEQAEERAPTCWWSAPPVAAR